MLIIKKVPLIKNKYKERRDTVVSLMIRWLMYGYHGGDSGSSNLRTVEVCGEHNDGVRQHVGSVCTGEQSLSVEDDIYQGNRK